MKKRLLSALLAVCMVMTMAPAAFAAEGDTLQAKIDADTSGAIQLEKDYTENIVIGEGKDITLDLNGHTISSNSADTIYVKMGATLKIVDTSESASGKVDNQKHGHAAIFNNGTVTLEGGTYDRSAETGTTADNAGKNSWYTICNHGEMTVKNGVTVTTANNDSEKGRFSSLFENGYYSYNGKDERSSHVKDTNHENPSLTIEGGTFSGGLNTIKNDDGATLVIKDGEFKNIAQHAVFNVNVATIEGGTFDTTAGENSVLYNNKIDNQHDKGEMTVTGGTFTAKENVAVFKVANDNSKPVVTGGTFSNPKSVKEYLDASCTMDENGTVVKLDATNSVAKIDGKYYSTLPDAVKNAEDGATIELLKDASGAGVGTFKGAQDGTGVKNFTIDFGGHTYTCTGPAVGSSGTQSQAFHLEWTGDAANNAKVTLKNGTVTAAKNSGVAMIIQNYCDLTLDNMVIDGSNLSAGGYALSNNCGNITIKDTEIIVPTSSVAFDVYGGFQSYGDVTVTLEGNSVINGEVEVARGSGTQNQNTLNIKGGFVSGKLKITSNENTEVSISGGYFTSDPSAYLADGKAAVESDKDGYAYMVADASTEPAEVVPEAPHINTDLPADATDADKKLAESVEAKLNELSVDSDALKAAAGTVAQSNTVSNEDGMKALNEGGISVDNAENVTIVVQPYLDITLKDASSETDGKKSFTVDITPKYRKVATTATDLSQVIVKGEEEDQETANAVIVAESVNLTVNRTVEVSIALPKDFVSTGENELYVHHQKNGLTYVYKGIITGNADNQTLTFTNPHGFSLFTITTESPVAQIGDNYYATLTDAVADVADGQTIELLKESAEKITVQRNVSFTVDTTHGTFAGSIEAGSNYSMTKTEKDGKITYTFTRNSSSSSSGSSNRTLTFNVNGGSELKKLTKAKGTTIDLSDYTPTRTGYTFAGWYSDKELTDKVTSIKLSENTTVYAKWTKNADETVAGFEDVKVGDWFAEEVQYVVDKGLMSGTSKTTFAPSATTTRGMIVAILHRLEKEPAATASAFTDVKAGAYYEKAINWAAANDIVKGVTETTFAPDQAITREQMAAILYRYAQFKGYDMSKANKLDAYTDAAQVSAYAVPAMQWANAENLITGKSATVLDPKGNATRAEVSSILMRFCENIAK